MSSTATVHTFKARQLWQEAGWQDHAVLAIDSRGYLTSAAGESPQYLDSWVLPGMPNLHSHAFQRAMAGLAERRGPGDDSFWTWRETMYGFAARIDPDTLQAIAAQLYVEMLKAGYTQVCEFHYLHHQPDGMPYAQPEAMSLALIEAAHEAGIALTLLPVLYMSGGFDGRPLAPRQRRFGHDVESYLRLLADLRKRENDQLCVGVALHSLRAIPEQAWRGVIDSEALKTGPIHIHIAEQIGEVQDCIATRGARPVEWLFDHAPVDPRWCLVHATHLTDKETAQLARSGVLPACVRPPKRTSVTGCFHWRITSMLTVYWASVPIRTSPSRRWKSCAGWNTVSDSVRAIATWPRVMRATVWAKPCGVPH
jgi:formimidoylglutamate deiminase